MSFNTSIEAVKTEIRTEVKTVSCITLTPKAAEFLSHLIKCIRHDSAIYCADSDTINSIRRDATRLERFNTSDTVHGRFIFKETSDDLILSHQQVQLAIKLINWRIQKCQAVHDFLVERGVERIENEGGCMSTYYTREQVWSLRSPDYNVWYNHPAMVGMKGLKNDLINSLISVDTY